MKQKPYLLLIFLIIIGFTTCGIDEYYYLPQIPQGSETATEVSIRLPSVSSTFYYASTYIIFYKIYLSNEVLLTTIHPTDFSIISSSLTNDWNTLARFLDTTTTNVPTRSDFSNRGYFELQFETSNLLRFTPGSTSDRDLNILFHPTEPAEILLDEIPRGNILRNDITFEPQPDRDFYSTPELRSNENAGSGNPYNHDIAAVPGSNTGTAPYSYVSMYILTSGTNPTNFNPIFSKPTHLGVFLLYPYF